MSKLPGGGTGADNVIEKARAVPLHGPLDPPPGCAGNHKDPSCPPKDAETLWPTVQFMRVNVTLPPLVVPEPAEPSDGEILTDAPLASDPSEL